MEKEKEENHKDKKNLLEWIVFGVSLVLVASILVYLGYKSYTYQPSPPVIRVEFSQSPATHAPYRYHLVIRNSGGETAEEVKIELVLKKRNTAMEKAEINLPFIPHSSKREGWVNFTMNPDKADTVLARVISFKKP